MEVPDLLANAIRERIRENGQILESGLTFLTERVYREVDQFKVEIFPNEGQHRGRPHCKVTTDKGAVSVDLNTFEIIVGDAGPWNRTICKVLKEQQKGLLKFWNETRPDDQKI